MRALLSVHDKTGLIDLARRLAGLGYELVSTGGTAAAIEDAGLTVTPIQNVTNMPEMLDGRVKTLHPAIHGGLLARRDLDDHMRQLAEHDIRPVDVVISNLYPFERAVGDRDASGSAKIEQIDIGGPAMVRAAAKNFESVTVVTDPADYGWIADRLASRALTVADRRSLAAKAFGHVATYDSLVAAFLRQEDAVFPEELTVGLRLDRNLRYGENPQQLAAAYRHLVPSRPEPGILDAEHLAGPELSFNNLLDADAAWQAAQLHTNPTVAIVKHTIPCGLATRDALADAYDAALAGDPISAFGGIVALNAPVDDETARRIAATLYHIVIAPEFAPEALDVLTKRKITRVLRLANRDDPGQRDRALDLRPIAGGMLVQTADDRPDDDSGWKVVTARQPAPSELDDLAYAWSACRLVKSNAIVIASERAVLGVGAGQPNRLESVDIAVRKAGKHAEGAALASDAFFPFADGVERAIHGGVTAVIQPGGSVRDDDVIAAANAAGIAMVFTGTRHFRH